jgi:hypothetical protein
MPLKQPKQLSEEAISVIPWPMKEIPKKDGK